MRLSPCPICNLASVQFETTLAKYPVGNVYLASSQQEDSYLQDFKIMQCKCGHLMALSAIPSDHFYGPDYPYLGASNLVKMRHARGVDFVLNNDSKLVLNNIIDVGCGNMNLLKNFRSRLNEIHGTLVGIDPVPLKDDLEGMLFINDYFETSQFDLSGPENTPNLIALENVLEHISDLEGLLEKLSRWIRMGDFVYICVPSLEVMIDKMRFEEFSHEHLHYFSNHALERLFARFGFCLTKYLTQEVGSRGYNFHLYRFEGKLIDPVKLSGLITENIAPRFELFRSFLRNAKFDLHRKYWGVCASELTPVVSYFMENGMHFLQGIIDNTESKEGKYMPGVSPKIFPWSKLSELPTSTNFWVTVPSLIDLVSPKLRLLGFQEINSFTF